MEFRKNLLAALLASATIMPMYGDNIKDNVTLPEMGTITGRITDADRQWMRVIYRHLDLDKDKHAALYFPEEIVDGQENLFRIIMRLLANNQLSAYEYLDGREVFTDQYKLKVADLLDRFHILYTPAKGSTERNPRFTLSPAGKRLKAAAEQIGNIHRQLHMELETLRLV